MMYVTASQGLERDFPDDLVTKTLHSQCRGPGFDPWSGNYPHCRWILYQLSHKGSPRILEWVAISFSNA